VIRTTRADLRRWYRREYYCGKIMRGLGGVPLMAAWNDLTEGGAEALRQEEDFISVSESTASLET
jgi:hypothetical protein